jgi:hypothetical protein
VFTAPTLHFYRRKPLLSDASDALHSNMSNGKPSFIREIPMNSVTGPITPAIILTPLYWRGAAATGTYPRFVSYMNMPPSQSCTCPSTTISMTTRLFGYFSKYCLIKSVCTACLWQHAVPSLVSVIGRSARELLHCIYARSSDGSLSCACFRTMAIKSMRLMNAVGHHYMSLSIVGTWMWCNFSSVNLRLDINVQDQRGRTPLLEACSIGSRDVVELLLNHNDIKVNLADDNGSTPSHVAAACGHEGVMNLLLAHPFIDVNVQDIDGKSSLAHACTSGHIKIATSALTHEDINVNLSNIDTQSNAYGFMDIPGNLPIPQLCRTSSLICTSFCMYPSTHRSHSTTVETG